ncbi:AfsR/SARP family transcriptional regulator [Sphaerisporangium sp. B11E5]|uniref:AfsR/SARP family transcriptional regulator n=1 Tax=Sphaerisporangium sp. B11E5 TaxID=3153563 RepID=UPI00325DFD29
MKVYMETEEVNLVRPQVRQLLALLALAEGHPLTRELLKSGLWDEDAMPAEPEDRLNTLASSLRRSLASAMPRGEDPVPRAGGGYRLAVDRRQVDVLRFRDKDAEARQYDGKHDAEAVRLWRAALGEWGMRPGRLKPQPLAGLPACRSIDNHRHSLQMAHRDAIIGCLRAELRLGRHAQVLPELITLHDADGRADEDLAILLMLALYRDGRQTDALEAYRLTARALKELGVPPKEELQNLRDRVMDHNPDLDLAKDVPMADTRFPFTEEKPEAEEEKHTHEKWQEQNRGQRADSPERGPAADEPEPDGEKYSPVFNNLQSGTHSHIYQAGYKQVFHRVVEDE